MSIRNKLLAALVTGCFATSAMATVTYSTGIDANHDGYVVRTELKAFGERMRPQMEAKRNERFGQMFADADANHDGKLSKDEVAQKMPRMAKQFAWLDDNRDGYLSQAELKSEHGFGFGPGMGRGPDGHGPAPGGER